jgi:hypothetical protein
VAPGARQPVGGFSALLKAPWRDGYLGMPDNGFGSKANSHSFLLRVYAVKPHRGDVEIQGAIHLRDPNHRIPFELVNEATEQRYLTGGDFDIESFRIDRRGTLWFGDEFGPFLLHTDATGKVLEKPIPLPGVRSPGQAPGPRRAEHRRPEGISLRGPVRPGDFGLGNPFRMPYQTIEAVLPVGRCEPAIVHDTNFGSTGRNPSLPDSSDFIRVRVPGLEGRRQRPLPARPATGKSSSAPTAAASCPRAARRGPRSGG